MSHFFDSVQSPLLAADFDYFRIPRARWELLLTRVRQMGPNLIMVRVPWGFHEFSQGMIDMTGTTSARRDVHGLLELCQALELPCLLRPGPYCDQGVLGEGLPIWLSRDDEFENVLPAAVEAWYKALSKGLLNQQWPAGPLVAIYIDAESSQDRSASFSKQLTEVKWRIWLRKRYDGIEALNAAYGTNHRTVNDVTFPATWSKENTGLEKDAKLFLEKVHQDRLTRYAQTLTDAGWQIPINPSVAGIHPNLPVIQAHSLLSTAKLPISNLEGNILDLQHPIQVDPDPAEIGQGSVWAAGAPIRTDGSARSRFWQVRHTLWRDTLSQVKIKGQTLSVAEDSARLVTCGQTTSLRFDIEPDTNPVGYRLRLNGELIVDDSLKAKGSKLSGSYLAEDDVDQTDLLLILNDPAAPLAGFSLTYLRRLLAAQVQTLRRSAALAESLAGRLAVSDEAGSEPPAAGPPARHALTTLEEARRGLSDADAALRKAMASIGGLEIGLSTILGQESDEAVSQAATPATVRPEIFEGQTRESLLEIGAACAEIFPRLEAAAAAVQKLVEGAPGFTVEQYRQNYDTAVEAARSARQPLLDIIVNLRVEIASENLPLVLWRIHDQVQDIAESLRWGVLRGQL